MINKEISNILFKHDYDIFYKVYDIQINLLLAMPRPSPINQLGA